MTLEPHTLLLVSISAIALVGCVAMLIWSQDRSQRAILWIVATGLLGSGSTLMREMLPSRPAIVLANITLLACASCIATACRSLGHRPLAWSGLLLPMLLWLLGCMVPAFMADQFLRITVFWLLYGLVMAWTFTELWRDRREKLRSRFFLQGVIGVQGLASLIYAGTAARAIGTAPSGDIIRTNAVPFVTLWLFGFVLLSSLGVILFVRERLEMRLRQAADQDSLTGLANRRRFEHVFEAAVAQARISRHAIALLMIDADAFKLYNDRYGHLAGDKALQQIADILADGAGQAKGLAARYGGEEFIVLLPGANEAEALRLAETMRDRVHGLAIAHDDWQHGRVTISIGLVSHVPNEAMAAHRYLLAADQALYAAKRAGRNQVQVWREGGPDSRPDTTAGAPLWAEPAHGALTCQPPTT